MTKEEKEVLKEKEKAAKEKEKIEKEKAREQAILRNYGLHTNDPRDIASVKRVFDTTFTLDTLSLEIGLLTNKPGEKVIAGYLKAIEAQNWIIIRYLDKLNRKLDRLTEKEDKNVD